MYFLRQPGGIHEERAFLILPIVFAFGMGVYFALDFEPANWAAPATIAVATLGLMAARERTAGTMVGQDRHAVLQFALVGLIITATGFSLAQYRTWSVHTPMLEERTGGVQLQGHIESVERMRDGDTRIVLSRIDWQSNHAPPKDKRPERVRLNVKKGGDKLAPGQMIQI